MLLGIGAGLGAFALQALMATFALTIGVQGGLTRSTVLWLFAAGSFVQIFALPAYAALSDRIGRRPVMIAGCSPRSSRSTPSCCSSPPARSWACCSGS